ncbi:MAG TPA: hypothetical protein VIU15_28250 [Streptomyces sp.]
MIGKRKKAALCAAALALTAGGWFAYQEIFTKGLERLPSRVCDGAADRDSVIRLLPETRSAKEQFRTTGTRDKFMFSCGIFAGDSILSGGVDVQDSSRIAWRKHYEAKASNAEGSSATAGEISVLSRGDFSSIYIPCVPAGTEPSDARQEYALIADVSVVGESRITGLPLRQALADYAYELTRRAYTLGKCQGTQDFPEQLPRFKEN